MERREAIWLKRARCGPTDRADRAFVDNEQGLEGNVPRGHVE